MKKNKKANGAAKETSPANEVKVTSKKDKSLTDANLKKAEKTAVAERVTKYIYPADVTTVQQKKEFRRKARAKLAAFTKDIQKLTNSKDATAKDELKKTESEFNTWKKATYPPVVAA